MLGARARAAEYNAAKAATARQQANKESPRLPPKSAPISLGAFTRNASYTRNRGAKSFIPLILSEEEEMRSTGSNELASDADQTDLTTRPASASLLPSQSLLPNKAETDVNTLTPLRHDNPQLQSHMMPPNSKATYYDEGYDFSGTSTMVPPLQYPLYPQAPSFTPYPNMTASSHMGWYTPGSYYSPHHSYLDADLALPCSSAERRPQMHRHSLSQDSARASEPVKGFSSEPALDSTHPTTPVVRMGGPMLHHFGPDDLSPTKAEIKYQARKEYFDKVARYESAVASRLPPGLANTTANSKGRSDVPWFPDAGWPQHNSSTKPRTVLNDIRNLLIDHDTVAPVRVRALATSTTSLPGFEENARSRAAELSGTRDSIWSTTPVDLHRRSAELTYDSPTRAGGLNTIDEQRQGYGVSVTMNRLEAGRGIINTGASQTRSYSTPTSSQSQAVTDTSSTHNAEHDQHLKPLLVDIKDPDWCEFRASTQEDRQRMIMLRRTMTTASISPQKSLGLSTIKHEDLQGQFQQNLGEYERRRKRVQELADEMQHKWERNGQAQGATITKKEAEQQAGRIREIGHMMVMLNMQVDNRNGLFHLGSRPYVQPPEYAIERSVSLDKEEATSLFEQEGHEGHAAPPRLARDPRFRAQLNQGVKIRGDEERIPRMFMARSRVQT